MDSNSLLACLGNFFKTTLRRIRPQRSYSSQATNIAPGKCKGRSVVAGEHQDSQVLLDADQRKEGIQYFSPHGDHSCSPSNESTQPRPPPCYSANEPFAVPANDVSVTIEQTLDELNSNLRDLSLKIHGISLVSDMITKHQSYFEIYRSSGTPFPGKVHKTSFFI
jgi:hypothetical protein